MSKRGGFIDVPKEWLDKVPPDSELNTERGKRLQILTLQRSLLARAMSQGATTAEVNACAKTFALLENTLNNKPTEAVANGENKPTPKPKRTAGLKSKLLSSAVTPKEEEKPVEPEVDP